MRIAGIVKDSIVDGPGLRLVVFFQGCKHDCLGCQNPATQDFNGGYEESVENIIERLKSNPLVDGVTFSGGDPFEQASECYQLAKQIRKLSTTYTIWCYTGYTFEHLISKNREDWNNLLNMIDVLVDGPFVLSLKSYELKFKGSSNQRLIDVPASLESNQVVLYTLPQDITNKFQVPIS